MGPFATLAGGDFLSLAKIAGQATTKGIDEYRHTTNSTRLQRILCMLRTSALHFNALVAPLLAMLAEPALSQSSETMAAPRVDIIGNPENLERIPGTGYILDKETLESSRVFTTPEALRKIAGTNVRDEEGLGLRPNIGVRGLNPTRSTKITLLEDGMPLSYAPYGDNASYYHPPIERYDRIEALRGAGQILYGPQTIGGAINYITPTPPEAFRGMVALSVGTRDYLGGRLQLGGRGYLFDYIYKQAAGARDNTFSQLNDVNLKKVFQLDARQALTLRANLYTEDSQVTYSGMTDAEYRNFGSTYNPFANDYFNGQRVGLSGTHEIAFNKDVLLLTNLYGSSFSRDWWRQSSTTTDSQCGNTFTQARLNGQAVNVNACNSSQGRLRDYYSYGLEPRLHVNWQGFGLANELDFGVRAHFESQERQQVNATAPAGRSGTVVEDQQRLTSAYSMFVMNKFIHGNVAITPGVRYEYIVNDRLNRLNGSEGQTTLDQLIPALGATWQVVPSTTLFAGVNRGFAPPRTEDLINTSTPTATYTDVGPEKSWNYELGLRSAPRPGLDLQATLFRNSFERLIAVGSVAGGNLPLSEGEALFKGLEVSGRYGAKNGFYSTLAWLWLPVAEQITQFTNVLGGAPIVGSASGKRLPYAPEQLITAGVGYMTNTGLDMNLEMVYVGAQYADFANVANAATSTLLTSTQAQSGQFGQIPSHTLFNATINYRLSQYRVTTFLAIKNIGNEVYIVDRTRGILPGMPRLVQVGVRYDF
jgi:Fe(3+) dicitrate transport protein